MWGGDCGPGQRAHRHACLHRCESQPGRGQGCAGSLMEEVAKADCVSAGLGGDGLEPGPAPGATHTHVTTPSGIFPPSPQGPSP